MRQLCARRLRCARRVLWCRLRGAEAAAAHGGNRKATAAARAKNTQLRGARRLVSSWLALRDVRGGWRQHLGAADRGAQAEAADD